MVVRTYAVGYKANLFALMRIGSHHILHPIPFLSAHYGREEVLIAEFLILRRRSNNS